jgi:hypothetical protein
VARIRLDPDVSPPALNSSVSVYMYYTNVASRIAEAIIRFFDLG